jgi:outer membrane protein insertion porin family
VFRRDYSSFRFTNAGSRDRDTTYEQVVTGTQLRLGFPVTEFLSAQVRYGLSREDVSLDESIYFTDSNGDGIQGNSPEDTCDPLIAGRYLCDALGRRLTSSIGYTIAYDTTDSRLRPTRGRRFSVSQDLAGLGGDVKYLRSRFSADQYWRVTRAGFILNASLEGGYIFPFGGEEVRLTDRFYLGQPRMRGFDIRGVGPRVRRTLLDADGNPLEGRDNRSDDAIGGQAYYLGGLELEIPLGASVRELGLRPSAFMDVGALWNVESPELVSSTLFREEFLGDSAKPRMSVGIGVNWNSPFGPFRIDLAKALLKERGDKDTLFQFNVGGQF